MATSLPRARRGNASGINAPCASPSPKPAASLPLRSVRAVRFRIAPIAKTATLHRTKVRTSLRQAGALTGLDIVPLSDAIARNAKHNGEPRAAGLHRAHRHAFRLALASGICARKIETRSG